MTTSTLAAEAAPVLSDLLSGFFDDGGLIRERAKPISKSKSKPKPIAEPYRPQGRKQKAPAKPITGPYRPRQIEKSKFKDLIRPREMEKSTPKSLFKSRKRINLNKGGSVTVPTKLGRTKKTKIY